MNNINSHIELGDCKEVLKQYPENYIDLIFTSPPYADRRINKLGKVNKIQFR